MIRIVVPLRLCPTQNPYSQMHWGKRHREKHELMTRILGQVQRRRRPLPGRPVVRATRYSRTEPDPDNTWLKALLDCLKPDGLGVIADDRRQDYQLETSWVRSRRSEVVVEILTEEERRAEEVAAGGVEPGTADGKVGPVAVLANRGAHGPEARGREDDHRARSDRVPRPGARRG